MISSLLLSAVVVAQAPFGFLGTGGGRVARMAPARCGRCGANTSVIASKLDHLRNGRLDLVRATAAVTLRRFDGQCHPEIVLGLAEAVRNDRDADVRAEAAVSLAKLGVCLPEALDALGQAAATDK